MYVSNAHQFLVNPVNFKKGPIIDIKKKKVFLNLILEFISGFN